MITIQVHNGKIHSDEAASVALLTSYFGKKNKKVSVIRSRDINTKADILVDVGLEYDHEKLRYDHHQNTFNETWSPNDEIQLSSVGLIWRHYGNEIVEMYLSANSDQYDYSFNYTDNTIEDIKDIIYYKLILELDANDNGIVLENYSLNIPSIISSLNGETSDEIKQNENFSRAVDLIGNIFDIKFKEIINSYFNFQKDLETVSSLNLSGPYLVLDKNIPTIFKCINQLDREEKIKFCIFCDEKKEEYTVKTVRRYGQKFNPLCPIAPEIFIRENLKEKDEIIFIHKASFIAKTKTIETAIKIVKLSLLYAKENMEKNIILEEKSENIILEEKSENIILEEKSEENIKEEKKINKNVLICITLCILGLGLYLYKRRD